VVPVSVIAGGGHVTAYQESSPPGRSPRTGAGP